MSTSESCKVGASNNYVVCDVNDKLQNMSTADDKDIILSICANCGKEGAKNVCAKCKQVKYCNAVCKKVHKKKHKKQCDEHIRLAAEHAARLLDIELFKQPPPLYEDCPICFLLLPELETGYRYKTCCGKTICSGCVFAPVYDNQGNKVDNEKQNKCEFCRTLAPKSEKEAVKRLNKLMVVGDPIAIYNTGLYQYKGLKGYSQDYTKAIELWHRAAELGYSEAYNSIGWVYHYGQGVEIDMKKANHYYELGAIGGSAAARYSLGTREESTGNFDRAIKHYIIATRSGYAKSLEAIKELYLNGQASKDDYTKALQLYQAYLGEIKSKQRDEAAVAQEKYRYY